jgi:hypothetical protein
MSGSRAVGWVNEEDITGFRIVGTNAVLIGITNEAIGNAELPIGER